MIVRWADGGKVQVLLPSIPFGGSLPEGWQTTVGEPTLYGDLSQSRNMGVLFSLCQSGQSGKLLFLVRVRNQRRRQLSGHSVVQRLGDATTSLDSSGDG